MMDYDLDEQLREQRAERLAWLQDRSKAWGDNWQDARLKAAEDVCRAVRIWDACACDIPDNLCDHSDKMISLHGVWERMSRHMDELSLLIE